MPTTLLAQVDSAIGGKVGVNHALGKNLIGAFHQPHAVVVDPSLLGDAAAARVPRGPLRSDQIRHDRQPAAVRSRRARRCTALFARDPDALMRDHRRVVPHQGGRSSRRTSARPGLRRILNFGHTAGHALEAVTKYRRFRHGEAVGYGMLVAAELAVARGALAERDRKALAELIAQPRTAAARRRSSRWPRSLDAMQHDKKIVAGQLHFVLPRSDRRVRSRRGRDEGRDRRGAAIDRDGFRLKAEAASS